MEKQFLDVLNAGLGLIKASQEGLGKAKAVLEKTYMELVTKGASDNSEATVKIRETVDNVINDIKEVTSVAAKNYEESRAKIIENYNKITEEFKIKIPEGQIEAVKAKINEVAEAIKNTTAGKATVSK
ncbi:chemotaxis protein [Leptospira interrogans]|nr:chemotaxis protein [Leptospira interrogans]